MTIPSDSPASVVGSIGSFMAAGGQHIPEHPEVPSGDTQEMRLDLIQEETTELHDAYREGDIEGIVDAGVDLAVVALGAALDAAPVEAVVACLEAVLAANAAKINADGTVHRREDGKILKPEGWQAPPIEEILARYARPSD